MPKSMRTVAELAKAVAVLQTRYARRAREVKALQGDIVILENRLISRRIAIVGETGPEYPQVSPATNSTDEPFLPSASAIAGTAPVSRVRSFLLWLRT